jgi:hypothetical protein
MSETGKSSSSIRVTMTAAGIAAILGSAGDFVEMFKPDVEEVGKAAGRADDEIYKNQMKLNDRLVRMETILEITMGMHFDGEDFIFDDDDEGVEEMPVVEEMPRNRRRPRRPRRPASVPEPDVRLIPVSIPDPEKLNSAYKAKKSRLSPEQMIAPPPDIFGKEAAQKAK